MLYPSQCESWLEDIAIRASSVGFPIQLLLPNFARIIADVETKVPQPLQKLDPLPEGEIQTVSPCLACLKNELVVQQKRIDKGESEEHFHRLQKYVEDIEQLAEGKEIDVKKRRKVFPCEVQCHVLHQNSSDKYFGFCPWNFKRFTKDLEDMFSQAGGHIQVVSACSSLNAKLEEADAELKDTNLDILLMSLGKVDALYFDLLAPFLPKKIEIFKRLAPIIDRMEAEHEEVWTKVSHHDLKAAESVVFGQNESWTLTQSTRGDLALLYHTAWNMLPALYMFAHQLMALFDTTPKVKIKVQGIRGRFDKLSRLDPLAYAHRDFTRVQDVLLCTCTFESLPLLAAVAEFVVENLGASSTYARRMGTLKRLGLPPQVQDLDIRLVTGKNRFADRRTGGVRSMKLLFSLHGFIAQVRFEYSACSKLMDKNGRTAYSWIKLFKFVRSYCYIGESKYEDDDLEGRVVSRRGFGGERHVNGDLYIGQWLNNKRHGKGTLWETRGNIYQGEFEEGSRVGHGTLWQVDGTVIQGEFRSRHHLRGTSTTWFANGSAEVMDHYVQLRAVFDKDRTKAILQLLPLDEADENSPLKSGAFMSAVAAVSQSEVIPKEFPDEEVPEEEQEVPEEEQKPDGDGVLGVSFHILNVNLSNISTKAKDQLAATVRKFLAASAQIPEYAIATVTILNVPGGTSVNVFQARVRARFRKDVAISVAELEARLSQDDVNHQKLSTKIKDRCEGEAGLRNGGEVIVGQFEVRLQQRERKWGTRSSICQETAHAEEECAQLGIHRGGPPKQVTIVDACNVQGIDHSPSAKPPVLQNLEFPKQLHHMIKQTKKNAASESSRKQVLNKKDAFITVDLSSLEGIAEFEKQFGIRCATDNRSRFDH
eukprot:gnl/MRDRNA2_/MRDRNA2_82889_c0_seq4.p1 gnl/MRDRNA2_/MRDRNA2_82889_c0~~gnl/MRDRNA2_/MRDRNA2_82889_c0_seq4.p1  ORF type:complete len:957 (+),score=169.18 gnl/MRDRNA2_/MRDRNA2_82889_c0_seq4:242-2872(+)